MTAGSVNLSDDKASASKSVRIPSLPGRQFGGAPVMVDANCDAYKAGFEAGAHDLQAKLGEQETLHEALTTQMGEMLADMDARYRRDCLSLVERLFAAIAPTLARRSSLTDILQLVEDRVVRDHSELTLRVHPSLIAHLPEKENRVLTTAPEIALVADESCAPAMVDAKWKNGGLFHDPDGLIEEVLRALGAENPPHEETSDER